MRVIIEGGPVTVVYRCQLRRRARAIASRGASGPAAFRLAAARNRQHGDQEHARACQACSLEQHQGRPGSGGGCPVTFLRGLVGDGGTGFAIALATAVAGPGLRAVNVPGVPDERSVALGELAGVAAAEPGRVAALLAPAPGDRVPGPAPRPVTTPPLCAAPLPVFALASLVRRVTACTRAPPATNGARPPLTNGGVAAEEVREAPTAVFSRGTPGPAGVWPRAPKSPNAPPTPSSTSATM